MTAMRSMLNISSDLSFDIFNDLSGVIFSVHLNLPNVADCYLKNHLNNFLPTLAVRGIKDTHCFLTCFIYGVPMGF